MPSSLPAHPASRSRRPCASPRAAHSPVGNGYSSTLVLAELLRTAGLRDWQLQVSSLGAVGLCIGLWIRAKTVDQDERGNAERRALFVGLWPPLLWLIGESLGEQE